MDTFNREDCLVVARFAMSAQCTRFVEGKFFLNDSGLTVRPKNDKELLPDFLNLQILFLNDHIYSLSRGTAQRNLDVPAFRNIKIAYPKSLPEQQRIVSILDEAFAAIAKAKANAEQNLKNAKELFESYLQGVFENGNWETKKLNEITEVKDGTHDSPKYIKEGIPFITQKNIKPNGLSFDDTKFITDTDHEKFYKRSNVAYGDILISMIGANRGMAAIVDDKRVFSIKNVGLIKSSDSINMNYLLYFLKSSLAMKYVLYMSNGGAQEFVGLTALRSFPIPFPTLKEQQTIVRQLDALRAETQKLEAVYQKKLDDLEELKKSILQKAFAGELKTEKAVAV
ncbi:MAG: restriction endonuclease subunit S [Saprospiraceae bacterium]|nr:restriction endonuclease subunit S [Candidatus Brachybacter algidus]